MKTTPGLQFAWRDEFYFDFDLTPILPSDWTEQILEVANRSAQYVALEARSVTSRELSEDVIVPSYVVDGNAVRRELPWLFELYEGPILDLSVHLPTGESYVTAADDLYAVNLNVQRGQFMRYECHVDSNPLQGVLYVTSHALDEGGMLLVSFDESMRGAFGISEADVVIQPRAGHLAMFDARRSPHYVSALTAEEAIRVAVTMNFYSPSSPESARPQDLTNHLFRPSLSQQQ